MICFDKCLKTKPTPCKYCGNCPHLCNNKCPVLLRIKRENAAIKARNDSQIPKDRDIIREKKEIAICDYSKCRKPFPRNTFQKKCCDTICSRLALEEKCARP